MSQKRRNRGKGRVISITNQKGGVGKTTLSYHLACFLARYGYKVVAIDLDGQGNLSSRYLPPAARVSGYRALHLFSAESYDYKPLETNQNVDLIYSLNRDVELFNVEKMDLYAAITAFDEKIAALQDDYDYIVIDTPPSYGVKMAAACIVQDHLFVPVELAAFAVDGVVNVLESLREIGGLINVDIKITGVICNKLRAVNSHEEALREMREEVGGLILKSSMVNRGAVDDALRDGVPVWQKKRTGAERDTGKEMLALMSEMASLVGAKEQTRGAAK